MSDIAGAIEGKGGTEAVLHKLRSVLLAELTGYLTEESLSTAAHVSV